MKEGREKMEGKKEGGNDRREGQKGKRQGEEAKCSIKAECYNTVFLLFRFIENRKLRRGRAGRHSIPTFTILILFFRLSFCLIR